MKKHLGIASAVLFGAAAAANAQSIGVQFNPPNGGHNGAPALAPGTSAGVVPQSNYNVLSTQSGGPTTLNDSTGTATGVSLTWTAGDAWTTNTDTTTANGTLLNGEDKTGGGGKATYTFTGLNPTGQYTLIAYTESDTAGVNAIVSAGGTSYYITNEAVASGTPKFTRAQNTSPTATPDVGNYVEFDNISPDSTGTLVLTNQANGGTGNNTAAINGLQLIPAVPEPASLGVLAVGGLGLLARRRRTV